MLMLGAEITTEGKFRSKLINTQTHVCLLTPSRFSQTTNVTVQIKCLSAGVSRFARGGSDQTEPRRRAACLHAFGSTYDK